MKKLSALLLVALAIGFIGSASAQSGGYGDFALSETVSDFNTSTSQVAFEVDNITDEDVDVEFIRDEEVVATAESVALDSTGFGEANLDDSVELDSIAVYPAETDPEDVNSVTLYYDYDGTGDVTNTSSYNANTQFTDFSVESGTSKILGTFLPWILVMILLGAAFEKA